MKYIFLRYQLKTVPVVNQGAGTLDVEILFFAGIQGDAFNFEQQNEAALNIPLGLTFLQMNEFIINFCVIFVNNKYNNGI